MQSFGVLPTVQISDRITPGQSVGLIGSAATAQTYVGTNFNNGSSALRCSFGAPRKWYRVRDILVCRVSPYSTTTPIPACTSWPYSQAIHVAFRRHRIRLLHPRVSANSYRYSRHRAWSACGSETDRWRNPPYTCSYDRYCSQSLLEPDLDQKR